MKFTIQTTPLQKNLPFVLRAISPRNQLPILLNFLLEAKENTLTISATDLEMGIHISLPAVIEEPGATTVPARVFADLVSSLSSETITFQTSAEGLEVIGKKIQSTFQTLQSEEFPKLYEEKGEELITIPLKELQHMLSDVVFAASTDMGRPALSGVLIKRELDKLLLVATDGYRLSLRKSETDKKGKITAIEKPLLIPARILREIISLKDGKSDIHLFASMEKNQVLFSQENTLLVGRLIGDEFPPYERIIPADSTTTAVFDTEELHKAVKISAIFARETANIIKLAVTKKGIIVSANTPSVGKNSVEVEATVQGEENEIAFNAKYLLDILGIVEADMLEFSMTGPLNPGVFKIPGDDSFLHIIMPIRVQG